MTTLIRNSSGFTLAELVVAMLIITVGMLGLLEALNLATDHLLRTELRNESLRVGEKYLNQQKAKPFDRLSSNYALRYEPSKVRGSGKPYSIEMSTLDLSSNPVAASKEITVIVRWTYKGVAYENRVNSPVALLR